MLDDKKLEQMSDDAMTFSILCQITSAILSYFKTNKVLSFLFFITIIQNVLKCGYGAKNLDFTEEQIETFFANVNAIFINKYNLLLVREEESGNVLLQELS